MLNISTILAIIPGYDCLEIFLLHSWGTVHTGVSHLTIQIELKEDDSKLKDFWCCQSTYFHVLKRYRQVLASVLMALACKAALLDGDWKRLKALKMKLHVDEQILEWAAPPPVFPDQWMWQQCHPGLHHSTASTTFILSFLHLDLIKMNRRLLSVNY